ncbi:hypothetical protein D3C72_1540180 [compost metagenome]
MKTILLSNAKKRFLGIMLSTLMILTLFAPITAFAAGTETFYKNGGFPGTQIGGFNCTNNNLSPVKTIGESGYFYIWGIAEKSDPYAGNVVTTVEIRSYSTGAVLTSTKSYATNSSGTQHYFQTNPIYLSAGQQIRIFTDVSSIGTPPGPYRQAYINYAYVLY